MTEEELDKQCLDFLNGLIKIVVNFNFGYAELGRKLKMIDDIENRIEV